MGAKIAKVNSQKPRKTDKELAEDANRLLNLFHDFGPEEHVIKSFYDSDVYLLYDNSVNNDENNAKVDYIYNNLCDSGLKTIISGSIKVNDLMQMKNKINCTKCAIVFLTSEFANIIKQDTSEIVPNRHLIELYYLVQKKSLKNIVSVVIDKSMRKTKYWTFY